jgi:hypothetical protein
VQLTLEVLRQSQAVFYALFFQLDRFAVSAKVTQTVTLGIEPKIVLILLANWISL